MSQQTKNQLTVLLNTNITDALNKQNTASKVRQVIQSTIDSLGILSGSNSFVGDQTITGSLIVNGNIIETPFLNNETNNVNFIRATQNIINHGDLLIPLNCTFIIEENAQYLILGELINNGTVIVSGSLIANQGITGPGSVVGPGVVSNNNTIITFDKANQAYGFPQLNNTGYSNLGFKNNTANLLSNYSTVATRLDGQQSVYSIDTTGWDANTQYLHYYLPEGQYEGQSVELIVTGNGVNLGIGNSAKIQIWIDSIRKPEYYGQLSGGPGGWQAFSDPNVLGNWRKDVPRAIWMNNAWTIDNDFYWD
jgi:hypothetical protein